MTTDSSLPDLEQRVGRLQAADAVVCVPACTTREAVGAAIDATRRAARLLPSPPRTVLIYPDTVVADELGHEADPRLQVIPYRLAPAGRLPFPRADGSSPIRPLSVIATRVGAKACGLVGARAEGITAETLNLLLQPVLDREFDLVLAGYSRHRLDGLINSAIVHPLTRALYGKRVDGQLGLDFGFSARFVAELDEPARPHLRNPPIWPLTEALERGRQVCQARLGTWVPPVESSSDVGSALSQVLGSLFEDMERHAQMWQRVRGSQAVPTVGDASAFVEEHRDIDVRAMIDSFQLGFRNLQEVWAPVLPPATLIELSRLTRVAAEAFRMPDELWARVVYDFALSHRLRVISRDHLLRALVPIYLAWVASFALEVDHVDRAAVEVRLERLCHAFEVEKRYLLARWRWPDRFNP